tara:strand:+ start:532 stop:1257 length:726 start_codon:yes stop_codon:yes gene_type:complete
MKKYILYYLPFYGVSIFLLSNILAMYYYPGGTIFNHESVGYDFFRNFLSQLGRVKAYLLDSNGHQLSNMISFRIWSSGMATTGFIFVVYYLFLPLFFNKKKLSIIGSGFAIIAGICFILTGITPGDIFIHFTDQKGNVLNVLNMLSIHAFFANNIFYFAFPSSLIYSYLIYRSNKINKIYGIGYYFFSVLIFLYVLIIVFGPSPFESEIGMIIQATSQKIIALSWVCSTIFLSVGIKNSKF